ncbi:MAG: NADH-quinone oxidoreductase subunit C [Nocardioides sp.]
MFGVQGTGDTSGYGGLVRVTPEPGSDPRDIATPPYGGWFDEVAEPLAPYGAQVVLHRGEITFRIPRDRLIEALRTLRDDLRFELCSGVDGVHYPADRGAELHAVYHLLSMTYNRRVRVETAAPDADPHLPSGVSVYPTLDWHEREAYDMFGLVFDGHPGLTRILMPDDWPGHPQRKDYPLGGIPVEYHGATIPPPDERRNYQ